MTNKNSNNDLAQSEKRFANHEDFMSEFVHALAIVGLTFLPIVILLVWER